MKFYTGFDRPPRAGYACTGGSMTAQEFKQDCDINHIVKRAQRTGTIPIVPREVMYGEEDETAGDLRAKMDMINDIKAHFDSLPSDIRLHFNNDALAFNAWVINPDNYNEAVKLGLVKPVEGYGDASPVPAVPGADAKPAVDATGD
ncbi:internal scaffolding protein [Chicken microvirus mg6_154]|nr:internal scaffolding protein [Chicken microvirus mg6_154]